MTLNGAADELGVGAVFRTHNLFLRNLDIQEVSHWAMPRWRGG